MTEKNRTAPTNDAPPPRCSLCGASRIIDARGRATACSLVPGSSGEGGCKDPLYDYDVAEARFALDRLYSWAMSEGGPNETGEASIQRDRDKIASLIGVSGPRKRT